MLYELHLTVDTDDIDRWIDFCENLGVKALHIALEGDEPYADQIMFAAIFEGTDVEAETWSASLFDACRQAGFHVIRNKLEVPLDKAGAYAYPAYHEAHVKSLIPTPDVDQVVKFARIHGWSASTNLLYREDDGLEKWYFTKRIYDDSFASAGNFFRRAFSDLPEFNWATVRMEMETVIRDDNEELDAGWASLTYV